MYAVKKINLNLYYAVPLQWRNREILSFLKRNTLNKKALPRFFGEAFFASDGDSYCTCTFTSAAI